MVFLKTSQFQIFILYLALVLFPTLPPKKNTLLTSRMFNASVDDDYDERPK